MRLRISIHQLLQQSRLPKDMERAASFAVSPVPKGLARNLVSRGGVVNATV